jgi:hypothetical protein
MPTKHANYTNKGMSALGVSYRFAGLVANNN